MKDEKSAAKFHYIKIVSSEVVAQSIAFRVVSIYWKGVAPFPLYLNAKGPTPIGSKYVAHTFLFGRWHDHLSAVVLQRSIVEMKISIHRNKLRFVLYIKLTCTWFKICILICCVCVIVRF